MSIDLEVGDLPVKSFVLQLPTILGSLAAMLVAFVSMVSGTSPGTCVAKSAAAFLVFAGFGLVLRFALVEVVDAAAVHSSGNDRGESGGLDVIVPGSSVADLLGTVGETSENR